MHRLEENKEEITDDLVASFIKDKMEIELSANEIDRSHKIGKPSPWKKRHIIIKFVHTTIKEMFSQTKKIKDFGISITESLTVRRMEELSKACN